MTEKHCKLVFCPTTTENKLKSIPYLYNRKKWTGWVDLNPRPQLAIAHVKWQLMKENITVKYMLTTAMSHATTATTKSDLSKRSNNNQRYFVLCNSCFWCASYLRHMGTIRCPRCKNEITEFMPIRSEETFLFQYDRKRGVSLQFLTV